MRCVCFVLSDHANWPGLQTAIAATVAQRVFVTHGQVNSMVRWLCEQGLDAQAFSSFREGRQRPVAGALMASRRRPTQDRPVRRLSLETIIFTIVPP